MSRILLLVTALAMAACGKGKKDGEDSDQSSARGTAAPAPSGSGSGSGSASAVPAGGPPAAKPARAAPADAAYVVLEDQGLVAIEQGAFRTLVDGKYVGARAVPRPGGGLWVYVDKRVARYDGELTPLSDAPAQLGPIAVGPDGTLWVSGEGLASYDGKAWKTHALPAPVKRPFVRTLVFAPDGARYGLAGSVIIAGRGDAWEVVTAADQAASDLALAGDGTLYASLRDGLARLEGGQLVPLPAGKGDAPALVTAPDGVVYAFGRTGAHRLSGDKLEPLAKVPFTTGQVFGPDGTLYGIPADGLRIVRRRADGAVDRLPADRDLPFRARSITVDARGRLWLVLEYGMALLGEGKLTLLTPGTVPELSRDVEAIVITGKGPDLPDVGLPKLINLKGVIVARGKPVPGVRIELCPSVAGVFSGTSPCDGKSFVRRATTGPDGSFTLSGVPLGGWHLVYQKSAGAWTFYFPPGCCAGLAKGATFDMENIEFGTSSK
ncbi:MAG TPA: hypothetical protein VNO30_12715 [Kofleriaceae bacterium]|nr:hypothetical protein [Kofleriaceae bacterium]